MIASMSAMAQIPEDYPLSDEQVRSYRDNGFIKLENVFSGEALAEFRDAVASAVERERAGEITPEAKPDPNRAAYDRLFIQKVNLWRRHEEVRPFVLSRCLGNLAARLAGRPMRLWH